MICLFQNYSTTFKISKNKYSGAVNKSLPTPLKWVNSLIREL